jgi:hypothetical protein
MPTWATQLLIQGGVATPLALLVWRLVQQMIGQANANADRWQRAAEAADTRADETQRLLGEVLSALRAVEALAHGSNRAAS